MSQIPIEELFKKADRSQWQAAIDNIRLDAHVRRLGDVEGHPFHGNQWTTGQGGSSVDHLMPKNAGDYPLPGDAAIIAQPSSAYPIHDPNGRDLQAQYSVKVGERRVYTAERQALHDALVRKYMAGADDEHPGTGTTPVDNPQAMIIGGGMASGKSTMVKSEGLDAVNTVGVNVDWIRADLPEVKETLAKGEKMNVSTAHEEASDIAQQLMREALSSKRNMTLDGTGNTTLEKLGGKVAQMRAAGHSIVANYVTVPVDEAQRRADHRAETTDRRFVPPTAMKEVHAAVSQIYPEAVRQGLFDKSRLFNTEGPFGSKPTLVAHSEGKKLIIDHPRMWIEFIAKGALAPNASKMERRATPQ